MVAVVAGAAMVEADEDAEGVDVEGIVDPIQHQWAVAAVGRFNSFAWALHRFEPPTKGATVRFPAFTSRCSRRVSSGRVAEHARILEV